MRLETLCAANMIGGVNTAIGANGSIDFFTSTTALSALSGLMNTAGRLRLASTPIATTATTTNVGTFGAITSNTVAASGTVAYFAILKTTTGSLTTADYTDNVVLTGSVGTTNADITFNTVNWDINDNVSITSLTFTQPLSS